MNKHHDVQCQLLGSVSLDCVRSGPSYMHRYCAFSFALASTSCGHVCCIKTMNVKSEIFTKSRDYITLISTIIIIACFIHTVSIQCVQ